MYYFNINNLFNIITTEKIGCTQVCKYVSEWLGIFDSHSHSYTHNKCSVNKVIHNCMHKHMGINNENKTYIVNRPVHQRLLSFYLGNYGYTYHAKGMFVNLSFSEFVDKVVTSRICDNHLIPYSIGLKQLRVTDYEVVQLKDLDDFFYQIYGTAYCNFFGIQ
jgi:hypothetical protein